MANSSLVNALENGMCIIRHLTFTMYLKFAIGVGEQTFKI